MTLHNNDIHVNAQLPLTDIPTDDEAGAEGGNHLERSPVGSVLSSKTPGRTPQPRLAHPRVSIEGADNVSYAACWPEYPLVYYTRVAVFRR